MQRGYSLSCLLIKVSGTCPAEAELKVDLTHLSGRCVFSWQTVFHVKGHKMLKAPEPVLFGWGTKFQAEGSVNSLCSPPCLQWKTVKRKETSDWLQTIWKSICDHAVAWEFDTRVYLSSRITSGCEFKMLINDIYYNTDIHETRNSCQCLYQDVIVLQPLSSQAQQWLPCGLLWLGQEIFLCLLSVPNEKIQP